MSSPIAACGPEKVLTKPILIGVCAIAGKAERQRRDCCGPKQFAFHEFRSLFVPVRLTTS